MPVATVWIVPAVKVQRIEREKEGERGKFVS